MVDDSQTPQQPDEQQPSAADAEAAAGSDDAQPAEPETPVKPLVLVAEDDRAARLIIARRLSHAGYEVLEAEDGVSAYHLAEAKSPAVILTDWMMPKLDGVELCRRIKENPALRRIYAIMVTARDSREDRILGLDEGADDYLVKPFDVEELMARVRVGVRIANLQRELEARQHESALLEMALALGNDINNPLTTLVGYIDMLMDPSFPKEEAQIQEWLKLCREEAMRISAIVKKLREMEQPKLTQCVGDMKMVDLSS